MNIMIIKITYILAAILFIVGLKRMSSPVTARGGIQWAGCGMLIATIATFFTPDMSNYFLMIVAMIIGAGVAWYYSKTVAMTDMPQMIAIFNGMGGGAAAAIAAIELLRLENQNSAQPALAVIGAMIGIVAFSGSLIAFAKLQGWLQKPWQFKLQQHVNIIVFLLATCFAILSVTQESATIFIAAFFLSALVLGVMVTLPIGGANMPIVISLLNAFTGLAVAFEGFVINNEAMIVAGTVVGAAGSLLTHLMAKAMNRSVKKILFSAVGQGLDTVAATSADGSQKPIDTQDAAIMLGYASKVIIIPGYGMAVAQAQHKVWELAKRLEQRGVSVKFAIHPVAGRMPGHMNVLLAEAGVPYDKIYDLDTINEEFQNSDVALVIGANDVVNPEARSHANSPIFGMPILNADRAKNVIVIKRGQGAGFSGVENALFYLDKTRMLYGDGQQMTSQLVQTLGEI